MAEMTILLYTTCIVVFLTVVILRTRKFLNFTVYHDHSPPKLVLSHRHVEMQTDNLQALQLNGEDVLREMIDIVCEYADANSLYNMTKVCKSWRVAALREKEKRVHLIEQWNGSLRKLSDLRSTIKAIPFLSLICYEKLDVCSLSPLQQNMQLDDILDYDIDCRKHVVLTTYNEQLPNRAVAFRVDTYYTMENGCLEFVPGNKNIMGLLFPSMDPRVRFHAATIVDGLMSEPEGEALYRLTEELGFNDINCKNSKSTILMFSIFGVHPYIHPVIEQLIKSQEEKGKEITFAGFYGSQIRVSDDDRPCVCCGELRMLLRISGPRLESWSTFIRLYARDSEIDWKLRELKSRVKSKRHNIGLVYAPRCSIRRCDHYSHPCGNSIELMRGITQAFPYIRFTGLFVNYTFIDGEHGYRSFKDFIVNNYNDDSIENQGSCEHVSIIIISYD